MKQNRTLKFGFVFRVCNAVFILAIILGVCYRFTDDLSREKINLLDNPKPTYMIYYGELDDNIIKTARNYDIVILHPKGGNITREQVKRIQKGGTCVLGYISIGEDLRTAGMTPEEMSADPRFTGDGTGPRVDARKSDDDFDNIEIMGKASPGGSGFASYYLDDNDHDGKPDFNPNFRCAYTNIGDPAWFDELEYMKLDDTDQVAGIREILTEDYGRGLGCDGLFLDTIDTCAPDSYTIDSDPAKTRFEWTAPGVIAFMERLKDRYPNAYILQNRGLFFYNYQFPHYAYNPRQFVDFLLFESYMLDSNTENLYNENHFDDNKNLYAPKIIAEANRPDGFKVLSLGYAEGPEEYELRETLMGESTAGMSILMEDIDEAQNKAGFSHYITDGDVALVNDFVSDHTKREDTTPPEWSSVHNNSDTYPREEPVPRIGVGQVEPTENGVTVRWDVAIDESGVIYTLYYQQTPFDFESDPELEGAQKVELIPDVGEGYTYKAGRNTYPYQATVDGLSAGEEYYFLIRARDKSSNGNEEKNTKVLRGTPLMPERTEE